MRRNDSGAEADEGGGAIANRRHVLAAAATGFRDFVARQGGCADEVLVRVGVEEESLADQTLALDLGAYVRMMELAARQTGKGNFGLWYGQQFLPEHLGLIGGIAIASDNLREALGNLAGLFHYHQQATEVRFVSDGALLHLQYRITDGAIVDRRQDAELTLGMFANVIRHCLGTAWRPVEVHCEHPRPADARDHEAAFGAPVYFGQSRNALLFRDDILAAPMPQRDAGRLMALREALARIGRLHGVVSLADRVKGEIRSRLPDGPPAIEPIADAVGMARWTLQRRLSQSGLAFSDLVDMVRRDLALRYVQRSCVPFAEIADMLGYSELSAFSRAFRRWFDQSPQAFRAVQERPGRIAN
jgi:AraC-like DNA-binding protein